MSLRELPPGQRFAARWHRLRYVPLVILIVLVVAAAVIGLVVKFTGGPADASPPGAAVTIVASAP